MSDEQIESAVSSSKTTRVRSTKSKSAPKAPDHGAEPSNPNEQKRKKKPAPKKASSSDATIDPTSTIKPKNDQSNENDPPEPSIKPKKKRAPKAEVKSEKTESVPTEKPVKMRKPKAPKRHSAAVALVPLQTISDAFENLPVTNLDDISPMNSERPVNGIDDIGTSSVDSSEKTIIDVYSRLAAKIDFSTFVGTDQWCVVHLPKSARIEAKSRLRKIIPGANKDDKSAVKVTQSKAGLFNRLRSGVNMLVHDEKNLIFGERANYDEAYVEDEPDDIDNLHRFAHQLRQLEDIDREIHPEYLVLHDGKRTYGVHESDADGKMKLATRKPIYDRFHDQQPEESPEKKTLLARLKLPFHRQKNDDSQEGDKSPSDNQLSQKRRKSSRKSLNDGLTTMPNETLLVE